jgi:hypothetical protein
MISDPVIAEQRYPEQPIDGQPLIKVVIAVQLFYYNIYSVGIFNIFTSPAPMY